MAYLDEEGQIPFLSKTTIVKRTEELLDEYWNGVFPIDIEAICDYLGVSIIPVQGLTKEFNIDAFISADFKIIYVDNRGYQSESYRYRFSLAHELGHLILHREYFSSRVDSFEEWQGLARRTVNGYVEFQANYFAGSLLMPEGEMVQVLNNAFGGSLARSYWSAPLSELAQVMVKVRNYFKVSKDVVSRRMQDAFPGIR